MLCSWIAELDQLHSHLPIIIYGITVLSAGLVALMLPETAGHKMPDTVKESENLKLVLPLARAPNNRKTNIGEDEKLQPDKE